MKRKSIILCILFFKMHAMEMEPVVPKTPESLVILCSDVLNKNPERIDKQKLPSDLCSHLDFIKIMRANKNDANQALLSASKSGQLTCNLLCELLLAGTQVNDTKTSHKITPLMFAVKNDSIDVVKALISVGADVKAIDNNGNSVLFHAILSNSPTMINLIHSYKIDMRHINRAHCSILRFSIVNNKFTSFETLLKISEININQANSYGQTPLISAIQTDCNAIIEILLEHPKIDIERPNIYGTTPLIAAVKRHNIFVAKILLKRGASIKCPRPKDNLFSIAQDNPFMTALLKKYRLGGKLRKAKYSIKQLLDNDKKKYSPTQTDVTDRGNGGYQ